MTDQPIAESETEGATVKSDSERLQAVHKRALDRFDAVAIPQQEIRAQALEARRFVTIPGAQWEGSWGADWSENAPRPEVDKITKSLEKIETDYRENRLTVDFVPVGDDANADTADTLDGMHRADSYDFKAQQARDNAFQEAIRGGFGAYELGEDVADPYDPESDALRVNPGMTIVDADQSVYFDGASVLYDKSDAQWAFVVVADPRATAEEKWGKDNIADWPLAGWKYAYDWYTPDLVRTAKYYEVEDVADTLIVLTQKVGGAEQRYFESEIEPSEIRDLVAMGWAKKTKPAKRKRVRKYILNGSVVLKDCGYIAGPNIPIVAVYGRRDFVDGQERFRGHVGKKMDRQRIYNTRVGKLLETDSIAPFERPVFDPTQIDAVQAKQWAEANIKRSAYLTAHALRNPDGSIAQNGPSFMVKPPEVPQVTAGLLQIAAGDLTDDDDNADQVKANTSADAMDIAAARVDAKSGIYLDNMRQSLQREGEIYKGKAREIYWEPGRKVSTLTEDGKDGEAVLAEPYLDENRVFRIRNDLTQGSYKVIASVQESTTTMRQKTVRQDMELAAVAVQAQDMELAQVSLLHAVMNQDGEGTQDMKDYARKKLISLGVVKPTPDEQAQIEQAAAAASQQPPSPQDQALAAATAESASKTKVNEAKAVQTLADAQLKTAQAEVVGGPEAAPNVPSGLDHASGAVEIAEKLASADLKTAQAEHLRHGMGLSEHKHALDTRKQDHAESTVPAAE